MLSPKPWRVDAIVRLAASVFLCVYAGGLLVPVLHQASIGGKQNAQLYALSGVAFVCLAVSMVLLWRPWQLEKAVRQMVFLLVFFYAGVLLGALALRHASPVVPSVRQMVIAALSFQGAALVFVHLFLRQHQMSWQESFGFANQWQQAIMLGIIVACFFLPLGWGLQWVSGKLIVMVPRLHLKPEEQQAVHTLQLASATFQKLALGLVTIGLAPLAEEILFRGILYPWLKQAGFPRLALWGSAVFFAAVHMNLVTFIPLLVLALALTVLYERTGNLLAPITAHALFNGANFVILYTLLPHL
jgi:membrane protease YdiL (CAAX protease family)